MFCAQWSPSKNTKPITKDDILEPQHWKQLEHLHDQLESFDEATLMVQGYNTNLGDHFQTLDWLLIQLDQAKQKFNELYEDERTPEYKWLAGAADMSWAKCNKYYNMADQTAAYYVAIVMNPTLKTAWFQQRWGDHPIRSTWLKDNVLPALREVWFQEYKGKSSSQSPISTPLHQRSRSPKRYTSCREHKWLKLNPGLESTLLAPDELEEYLSTNLHTVSRTRSTLTLFSTGIIATLANPISHNLLLTPLLSLLCPTNANAYLAALRCLSPIAGPASRSILLKQMSVFEPGTGDRKKAPLRIRRSDGRKANNGTIRTNKRVLSVAKRVVLKTATLLAALLLIR
jgi:hypothetical protein